VGEGEGGGRSHTTRTSTTQHLEKAAAAAPHMHIRPYRATASACFAYPQYNNNNYNTHHTSKRHKTTQIQGAQAQGHEPAAQTRSRHISTRPPNIPTATQLILVSDRASGLPQHTTHDHTNRSCPQAVPLGPSALAHLTPPPARTRPGSSWGSRRRRRGQATP